MDLAGEQIEILAHIVAVADARDILTSKHRQYQLCFRCNLQRLYTEEGALFGPFVIDRLLSSIENRNMIISVLQR